MSTIWQLTGDIKLAISCTEVHQCESTDGNFGTREKVAIPIPIVTCTFPILIPIFGIFVFPFPCTSLLHSAPTTSRHRRRTRATRCLARIVLYIEVDAQCNKLVTVVGGTNTSFTSHELVFANWSSPTMRPSSMSPQPMSTK